MLNYPATLDLAMSETSGLSRRILARLFKSLEAGRIIGAAAAKEDED